MKFKIGGVFTVDVWRRNMLVKRLHMHNGITKVGLNDLLGVAFRNQSQNSNWYFGLIDGASSPTLSANDTMGSHAGWTENTSYSETARQAWVPSQSGDGKIVNTSYPAYSITSDCKVAGCFIATDDAKSGTAGILWSTGSFSNGLADLEDGDILKTYYELTATSS